jgi:undecaprenyl-diphosphatase
MTHPRSTLLEWLGKHELTVLLGVLIVASGTWGFIELAVQVRAGQTQAFDQWVLQSLRRVDDPTVPVGPTWMQEIARDITALGGVAVLVLVTLAVTGFLLLDRKFAAMGLVLTATVSGLTLGGLLKAFFARPRPAVVPHLAEFHTSSFPSGHSMMSAVVYLTLGALLCHFVTQRGLKFYFLTVALALTVLVGFSRVYLGVHYPTDVLAGWSAGLVWATLCWLIAHTLRRRGTLEERL